MATEPVTGWETAPLPRERQLAPVARPGTLTCLDWRDLSHRIVEWDDLAGKASEPNPFMESWFLLPALQALADSRVHVLCFEVDGMLCGLLPVRCRYSYYGKPVPHLSSWLHENCFLGIPLVASGSEVAFWQAILDWADSLGGPSLFLHLRKIPLGGTVHAALEAAIAIQPRRAELVMRERRALLESDLSPDEYWQASLSAKKRKELRRQANRLAELGEVTFERALDASGLDDWIDSFLDLEAGGWKGDAGSAMATSQATARLFRSSLAGAAKRGRLERLTLSLDGRPVAMLANFLTPPGAFSFKTAFDEALARYSPGVLLQQHNLAILDNPDIAWSDSCASEDHPMIDHIWRERRAIGHISIAIGGKTRRAIFGHLVDLETAGKPPRNSSMSIFAPSEISNFAQSYPETPHVLKHRLHGHPLLELERLAQFAESLPASSIEYNFADLPVGIDGKPAPTGIPIGQTIREIATSNSWAVLKNIEQHPEYGALLDDLLAEFSHEIERRTGTMLDTQGFIFVTSPGGVTPYHFDPEHNILLQIRGSKVMTQFPAGDAAYAPDEVHERYHIGGPRELQWRDELIDGGCEFAIGPGDALFVPVMAPHFVRNGPEVSISLSITWRSEWSHVESDARVFNAMLRRVGLKPSSPGRWPHRNLAKAYSFRALRKIGATRTSLFQRY